MTLEEIKKTGDKKAILKYRTQCAKDSVKEYREQMRDTTPEEQEAIDKYIKSISKPTGVNIFDFYEDENKSCDNCKHHLKFMCKNWETCHDYSDWELEELDFVQPKRSIPCTIKINTNSEYINKQQVMSDYADWYGYDYQNNWFYKHLKNMSSVNIPNKVGHLENVDTTKSICSICGVVFSITVTEEYNDREVSHCPFCGCPMEIER